ncbi:MAG: RdgB/HAM1 family non-canonical purine pyrophosphatase, dITP/XTP pyrophosphatase, partial [Candidatus Saccharibacteria bacterium]|nr:RdgB/HAM1 family non-canonical purine pyrophosphatase, dITP/XTP pyrophosphatase [Candidatus Saccharibacteria bacterium]
MADFTFVTSNQHKVMTAKIICDKYGVTFDSKDLDIVEVQDDDGEVIAADKARQAFEMCASPVVVNDTTWIIPGLNGWPGPYMKQMNTWFTPDDFVRLTAHLKDRR